MDVTRDPSLTTRPPALPTAAGAKPLLRAVTAPHPNEASSVRRPPRVDPALREYPALALPGWLGLLVLLLGIAAVPAVLIRAGVLPPPAWLPDFPSSDEPQLTPAVLAQLSGIGLVLLTVLAGLFPNGAGHARVLSRWGRYRGTIRRTGLVWLPNPLLRRRRVDVRLRHWRSEPVQVTDRAGTPLVVRLLVVWRVKDTARALLGIAAHEHYLREQAHAVLTRTAALLPCDSHAVHGPALRDGQWFADELTRALLAEAAPAGIEIYSVQPLSLEYAPEVADSMRRRRIADLDAGVRTVLVDDAVEAAALAVRRLERATAQQLDEAARAALMEQLLVAFVTPAGVTAPGVPAPAAARRAGRRQ